MTPSCATCRGACCEELRVRWWDLLFPWVWSWLRTRGVDPWRVPLGVNVDQTCQHLTEEGYCGIWHRRPVVCRAYPEAGAVCREVYGRRRT